MRLIFSLVGACLVFMAFVSAEEIRGQAPERAKKGKKEAALFTGPLQPAHLVFKDGSTETVFLQAFYPSSITTSEDTNRSVTNVQAVRLYNCSWTRDKETGTFVYSSSGGFADKNSTNKSVSTQKDETEPKKKSVKRLRKDDPPSTELPQGTRVNGVAGPVPATVLLVNGATKQGTFSYIGPDKITQVRSGGIGTMVTNIDIRTVHSVRTSEGIMLRDPIAGGYVFFTNAEVDVIRKDWLAKNPPQEMKTSPGLSTGEKALLTVGAIILTYKAYKALTSGGGTGGLLPPDEYDRKDPLPALPGASPSKTKPTVSEPKKSPPTTPAKPAKIFGYAKFRSGAVASGCKIDFWQGGLGSETVITDKNGYYELKNLSYVTRFFYHAAITLPFVEKGEGTPSVNIPRHESGRLDITLPR